MKRRSERPVPAAGSPAPGLGIGFQQEFPLLYEYLSCSTFDDGSARETSTLLVFIDEGGWKACLNDRQEGLTLWACEGSHGDLLGSLESQLASDCPSWRASAKRRK